MTFSSRGQGVDGMALAGLVVLAAACASGGGNSSATLAETEALFAGLTGVWVLDEAASSTPALESRWVGTPIPVQDFEQARQEAVLMSEEETRRMMAVLEPVLTVSQAWKRLILRVDDERLVLVPTLGDGMEVPMSGEWVEQTLGGHPVRARVYRDGDKLALEHRPHAGGQARAVLEIVDGRLRITQRKRVPRTSWPPWVLVYDRDEAGK